MNNNVLTFMMLSAIALGAAEWQIGIPFVSTPPSLDGNDACWHSSAVVRRFFPKGSQSVPQQQTEFRLCYDAQHLYVNIWCQETEPSYPEAYARPWHDLLFNNDDTVQVVLGVADPELSERGIINVGGYEGAMGTEVAKADMYYLYTVNAVNSRQRAYNEGPLEEAAFDSKVTVTAGKGWRVVMRIPFADSKLSITPGMSIYGNLFRFRPPEMLGWNLPGFGGYIPMPFGIFTFLPPGQTASQEDFPSPPAVGRAIPKQDLRTTLHYGPLSGTIAAEISVNADWLKANPVIWKGKLAVEGLPTVCDTLSFQPQGNRSVALLYCDFNPREQRQRHASFSLQDADGHVLATEEKTCEPVPVPDWLGTDAGLDYVSKKIPAPWTQPVITGHNVTLLNKTIQFGCLGLPSAIIANETSQPLLAAEPVLRIVKRGHGVSLSALPATLRPDGNQVRIASSQKAADGTSLQTRVLLDYDGFMDCKLAICSHDLTDIESIQLCFPLARGLAKYILPAETCQSAGALTGAGWRGTSKALWIGNEELGLNFTYDESPFHSQDARHQIELRQSTDGDMLVFNFVTQPQQLVGTECLFRFFLLPTPSKPYPQRPVRTHVVWHWENWSRFHGYPDLSKIDWIKEQVKKNEMTTLYCCQGLQENAPEFQQYRHDFEMQPSWRYYVFNGHDCFATCKRGPEGDFQLHRYRQLIAETGISGIMSDGLTVNWHDRNPLHHGCGRPYSVSLEQDTPSRTILTRRFLKRMRGLFTDTGRPFCMVAHTGGGLDPVTLSFVDAYFEGEQLTRYRRGFYPSLPMFAVGYSGHAFGWRTIYWPKQLHNYNGLDTALCYALLFNSEYYVNPNTEPLDIDVALLERFAPPAGTFYPFWRPCPQLYFTSDSCLASLYLKDTEAMLVVSNLTYAARPYQVNLSKLFSTNELHIEDALLHTSVQLRHDGTFGETLAPFSCRVLILTTQASGIATQSHLADQPEAFHPIDRFATDDWDTLRDVRFDHGELTIQGQVQQPAQIQLKQSFGQNLSLHMQVKLCERFRLTLGPCNLTIGGGWPGYGWMVTGPAHPYGRGWIFQQIKRRPDVFTDFSVTLRDGVLNVRYDGKVVVKDLAMLMPPHGNKLTLFVWHTDRFTAKELSLREFDAPNPSF